jgi:peptidase E
MWSTGMNFRSQSVPGGNRPTRSAGIQADQRMSIKKYDCDVIYLTGGNPIGFRRNVIRAGLAGPPLQYLTTGRTVVAASGGSMLLTKNVSLFRLLDMALDEVFENRDEYQALGVVGYEILPHLNRVARSFLETVCRYSERVDHDVIGLADGASGTFS